MVKNEINEKLEDREFFLEFIRRLEKDIEQNSQDIKLLKTKLKIT